MINFKKINRIIFSGLALLLIPLATIHADWATGLSNADSFGLPNALAETIITNFLLWILTIFTVLAVLSFVVNGIMFFTAGANSDNAEKAKKMVVYSILGIVIGLSGYIIITLIDDILMGTI